MKTTRSMKCIIYTWELILIGFFLVAGSVASVDLYYDKMSAIRHHEARMSAAKIEKGYTAPQMLSASEVAQSIPVKIGVYIDRIVDTSIRNSAWIVDFYIWFNWKGSKINPGGNFQIVDGEILSKTKKITYKSGERNYALYRIKAKVTKFFNVSRFPLDDHVLTIKIEDNNHQFQTLRYIGDQETSNLSSRVKVPGYRIYRTGLVVKPHSYKTSRGDPRLPTAYKATYSQFIYGIWMSRPNWSFYFKIFWGIFGSVGVGISALFLAADSHSRFELGVGAFFASVASTYITSQFVPNIASITMVDMVNGIGMTTIFLSMATSIISFFLISQFDDKLAMRNFQRVTTTTLIVGYIMVNFCMAMSAAL